MKKTNEQLEAAKKPEPLLEAAFRNRDYEIQGIN